MKDYQDRVVQEQSDLVIKIDALVGFMHSKSYGNLDSPNQGLLMVQLQAMENYDRTLSRRIELFNND